MKSASKVVIVLAVYFLASAHVGYGQELLWHPPRQAVKFSPLHAINPELASVQVAYEYRFVERFSAQMEVGYVFGDVWWNHPLEKAKGVKLKEDLRWYYRRKVLMKRNYQSVERGAYLAVEFHQNWFEFTKNDYMPYCEFGQGIKVGFVRYSTWGFMFDMNVGLSVARTNMEPFGIPLNDYEQRLDGYKAILPIVGIRLGYWVY